MKTIILPVLSLLCLSAFAQMPSVRINIYAPTGMLCDGVFCEYDNQYSDSVTWQDAIKFKNITESLCITRHNTKLAVERRPLIIKPDTIFLSLFGKQWPGYSFKIEPKYLTGLKAFFYDVKNNQKYPLNLADSETVVKVTTAQNDTSYYFIAFEPDIVAVKSLVAYPNPVCNNGFQLEVPLKGVYQFQIFSDCGVLKYQSKQDLMTDGGVVHLKANLQPGLYYVRVELPNKTYRLTSFFKQ